MVRWLSYTTGTCAKSSDRRQGRPRCKGSRNIAHKVKFAIQLLRETADLLETSPKSTFTTKRTRYPRRRSVERDE